MKVIHFTEGAADFFESSRVSLTKFVPLLQGTGDTYVTCLHLLPGAMMVELPTSQACALIVVSGFMTANTFEPNVSVELRAGVGVMALASMTGMPVAATTSAQVCANAFDPKRVS